MADLYNQIANIYSGFDKLDDALKYYNLSLKYYKKHPKNNKTSLAMVYTNIGIIYKTQKKYKKAMELFKNALKIQKEVNNRLEIAALYAQIGMIYYVWGNYNSALKYEKMALKIDEELKNRDDLMGVYFTLSYIYEKLNNYKLALFYRTKYVNLYASTYSEENFKKLASLKTKYEKLKAENELIKLKNKEKSYKLMKDLFVLIIVFVFVLAGFIIERIKNINQHNRKLSMLNTKIKRQFAELKEVKRKLEEKNKLIYEKSIRDALTNLYNRLYLIEHLSKIFYRAKRYNEKLSIAITDIDDFKLVNDTYGHLAGDYVLRTIAKMIKTNLRESDIVARYGGEEFIIIFQNTDIEAAYFVMEKIRKMIETKSFEYEGKNFDVTISIGISDIATSNANSSEELLKYADEALYFAKSTGKNCTKTYPIKRI